jgi:hypothetical protein
MLRTASELVGCSIRATDGDIGHVADLLFDDDRWTVRYLLVDTGDWLPGREVLVSPIAVRGVDWDSRHIEVGLTRDQVENSPDISTDRPVSRVHEAEYSAYYGWPYYWIGSGLWGASPYPADLLLAPDLGGGEARLEEPAERADEGDPHLQSVKDVTGYEAEASDGEIGSVSNFLVDDRTWSIRYIVVDTGHWLPGKKVLVTPESIERVEWETSRVTVSHSRDVVRAGPEFDAEALGDGAYEVRLDTHFRGPHDQGA